MAGAQDKTEKPTEKKLRDARERGQIARSKELTAVSVLLVGGSVLYLSHGLMLEHFRQLLTEAWVSGFRSAHSSSTLGTMLLPALFHFFVMVSPTLLSILIMGLGINLVQTKGLLISWEAIQFKFSRLNPLEGFKQLFSLRSLVEVVKSIVKVMAVGWVVYGIFREEQHLFLPMVDQELSEVLKVLGHLGLKMLLRVSLIMFALSIADYYYQAWQHRKDLMMSKQEIKEEFKQSDGNPEIKSRIRSIQRALARQRMMAKVPKATAIVVNPTHYAVALQYAPKMEAPRVVAKGVDFVARRIIKLGRRHGVPVIQNPPLARALYKEVKLEGTIPISLYRAVAKVLAYVYQQKQPRVK